MRRAKDYNSINANIDKVYEQSSDVCFISVDASYNYIGCNNRALELFPEIINFKVGKSIPSESTTIHDVIIPEIKSYAINSSVDNKKITIDNISWELRIHAIQQENNVIIGYLAELIDVTDRIKFVDMVKDYNDKLKKDVADKTRKLQDMQNRMIMGFEHSETAYSIIKVEVDENNRPVDWIYVYINDAMARLLGVGKDELIGVKFLEQFPDGDSKWLNYYYPAAFENKSFSFEATPQEIGIFMRVQCFPLDYGYCGCVFEDTSTTKEILRNKADLEMINNALCSDYIITYVVDMETGLTHLQEKNSMFRILQDRMFRRGSYDELSNVMKKHEFVYEEDKHSFDAVRDFERLRRTMNKNPHYTLNYRVDTDGVIMYYQTNFVITYNGNKKYCIVAIKNIDNQIKNEIEQKLIIEEALKNAQRANDSKNVFLTNISHEIRTSINGIMGMNEIITRECNDATIKGYTKNVQKSGDELLKLVNDVLDFSMIESGKLKIIPSEYSLEKVIKELDSEVRPLADAKSLQFIVDVDKYIPNRLYGDSDRIKQIALNLLTNAIKFTQKGSVTFKIWYERDERDDIISLCMSVIDTGLGIAKENIDKIFGSFESLEQFRYRTIEGSGLGLSITQSLLNLMGSKLEVNSAYGKGSTFTFKISQKINGIESIGEIESAAKAPDKEAIYEESFTAKDAQILAIDDAKMNLTVIKALLKKTLVNLDLAISGEEGLIKAQDKKYDLILLDHMMPHMDGIETLSELKKGGINNETPVIVLTANVVAGAREEYLEAGFDDYITKPVNSKELEKMIVKYLPKEKVTIN